MRVIAGALRGRPLRAPRGTRTRPTADRVRQALFSILGDVQGARVVDLYAGSGALGIEALSRGAAHAVFVESSRAALDTIRDNLRTLGLERQASVLPLRVERAAQGLEQRGPYDLVLCDPPWPELDRALLALGRVLRPALLAPGARVVLEHPAQRPVELPTSLGLECSTTRRWGDSAVTVLVRREIENPTPISG